MRRWLRLALFVAFVGVPLLEIYVIVQVGQVIGAWWTIALLVLDSLVGAWLVRREGARAWRALREALGTGRMPGRELADGALILVGGTLMLTPGFVTDAVGILLILPMTRPASRRLLSSVITQRLLSRVTVVGGTAPDARHGDGRHGDARHPGRGPRGEGPVVRGEVVDDD